jgi:branched-chain amino acid transport system substrate-binding protein
MLNWVDAAQRAGSIEPADVLPAMKASEEPHFVFGEGQWWGSTLWGLDNAVVGRWPVVVVEDGKARIQEYRSVSGWLDKNETIIAKNMKDMGLPVV